MSGQEILKFCLENGFIIDKELFESLSPIDFDVARRIIEKIKEASNTRLITKTILFSKSQELSRIATAFDSENKKRVEKIFINLGMNIEITKESEEAEREESKDAGSVKMAMPLKDVRIISSYNIPTKKFKVADFARHFRNRFVEIKKLMQDRPELQNLVSINKIGGNRQNFSIIGAVLKKRATKNKNILLELEDLTGRILVLANHDRKEIYEKAKEAMLDDIIAVKGSSGSSEIIYANDIIYPDIFLAEKKRARKEEYALFTSDLHVGSKRFLEKNFLKFIEWINGRMNNAETAGKVKYLFITGDSVDGVGVYPGQEDLLLIKDIKKQYEKLAGMLKMIRKDVNIILCPGQHDAVRVAEPQPMLDRNYAAPMHEIQNLNLVSNPAIVEISDGINVLMYHGASIHSFVSDIEELRVSRAHETPTRIIKHMLKRRHLAPTHSSVVYVPNEAEDPLFIKKAPDIITTGEVHRADIDIYNNILMISSSCWQSTTPFEEKIGNNPIPCKVPMLNLKTREIKILDFSDEGEK